MADRDYYNDRERSRGFEESRGNFGRDRDRQTDRNWSDRNRDTDDRGPISRGADEVRSWFGDDEARRRREMDESRERSMDPTRGRWEERGRSGGDWRPEPNWSPYGSGFSGSGSSSSRGSMTGERGSNYGSGSRGDFGSGSRSDFGGAPSGYSSESWGSSMGSSGTSIGRSSGFGESGRPGSFAGRGPRNYQRSDERIREEVNERLTDDPRVDAVDIEVEVRNGEVTLRGRVDQRRDKRTAEEVVENLPGVKDVRNELRVERGSGWSGGGDRDRNQGDRNREEGSIGHTGNPQQRDDMTTLNLSGTAPETSSNVTGAGTAREKSDKADKK